MRQIAPVCVQSSTTQCDDTSALLCGTRWSASSVMERVKLSFDFEGATRLAEMNIETEHIDVVYVVGNATKIRVDMTNGRGRAQFDEELNQLAVLLTKNQDIGQTEPINNDFTVVSVTFHAKKQQLTEKNQWKRFKRRVATFLEQMGIGEFEMSVDMAREQLEAKLGRVLTTDEKACFGHVFAKKTTKRVVETVKIEEYEEEDVVEVKPKVQSKKQPKRGIIISDAEEDEEEVTCTTPKKKVKLEYADIDDELDDGATCPLCGKIFKADYVADHAQDCGHYIHDLDERRERARSDLTNRKFRQRRRIAEPGPSRGITGRRRAVESSFVGAHRARGFYANEEHIRATRHEQDVKEANKRPEPIRLLYPYFEKPSRPYSKCPICIMFYYDDQMEEHGTFCANSVLGH